MAARYVIVTIIVAVRCNLCCMGEQCWFVGVLGCVLCCEE